METKTRGKRLKDLREARGLSHAEVGKELGRLLKRKPIGKGTVWKWEKTAAPDIELDVFFALAELYEVDPRELATGKKATRYNQTDLLPSRFALISAYGRLPSEIRAPIRAMIETLDTMLNPRYQEWAKKEGSRVSRRDAVHEPASS
jgi:transcriptional regulator with XRE-family HTH domain